MSSKVNWEFVEKCFQKDKGLAVGGMYGYPENVDCLESVYAPGVELQPKWNIPEDVAICAAIVGGMQSRKTNPNLPITVEEIRREALEVCEAGAANVHIHVRDDNGIGSLDLNRMHQVIDPIKEKYPDVIICGCLVPFEDGDWKKMEQAMKDNLFDQTPVNTVATYVGDTLLCKPPHAIIRKAELCNKYQVKPQIACYSDGDIDNARRYLINTGMLEKPYSWLLLPGIVGTSPIYSPLGMLDTLASSVRRIREIDEDSEIMVCAGGRSSGHIVALSMLLGLNVRVGMEDTVWKYPHKDELITSNAEIYRDVVALAKLLGRRPSTPSEYARKFGLKRQGGRLIK